MSIDTSKPISKITYNGVEIPINSSSSSSEYENTTLTLTVSSTYLFSYLKAQIREQDGKKIVRTLQTQIGAGTHTFEILVNSSIYLSSLEGNNTYYYGEDAYIVNTIDSYSIVLMIKNKNPTIEISN